MKTKHKDILTIVAGLVLGIVVVAMRSAPW
jgi:hypothetical protein